MNDSQHSSSAVTHGCQLTGTALKNEFSATDTIQKTVGSNIKESETA